MRRKMMVVESIIYIDHLESVLVTYQDVTKRRKGKGTALPFEDGDSGDGAESH